MGAIISAADPSVDLLSSKIKVNTEEELFVFTPAVSEISLIGTSCGTSSQTSGSFP